MDCSRHVLASSRSPFLSSSLHLFVVRFRRCTRKVHAKAGDAGLPRLKAHMADAFTKNFHYKLDLTCHSLFVSIDNGSVARRWGSGAHLGGGCQQHVILVH